MGLADLVLASKESRTEKGRIIAEVKRKELVEQNTSGASDLAILE